MIRNLIALAVLALLVAPLVSLHQLGGIGVRASVLLVRPNGTVVTGVAFEAALAATRL